MFAKFSHYLSYGATDQQTARELRGRYDGLLVPGTIAAFQSQGTQGFVLTMSASTQQLRYTIDPRFPLFQQRLEKPKKSHQALADLLGDPALVQSSRDPGTSDFDAARISQLAASWIDFNSSYENANAASFDKYAQRLGEEVIQANGSGPSPIFALYAMDHDDNPAWWDISQQLWDQSMHFAAARGVIDRLRRVVAVDNVRNLASRASSCDDAELAIWVNGMNELEIDPTNEAKLLRYARAIRRLSSAGKQLFALYGGFFAVLMGIAGLRGASHGIGYGEFRDWHELPQSGPPPARYYLPMAHRYVSVDLAQILWQQAPYITTCGCAECVGTPPGALDYHQLMMHSVHCRASEISTWAWLSVADAGARLDQEHQTLASAISGLRLPPRLERHAHECYRHLPMWSRVLQSIFPY